MALYALVIFLGSFLLFQIQPLIGRFILPWFGGGPAVWTTCMLFFQVLLLVGYGYAHLLTAASRRVQGAVHGLLLAACLLLLPVAPSAERWQPSPGDDPVLAILLLLLATIGVPYLALSANAPLLQHWFLRANPDRSPYRLYALSNGASLLALLSYPFLVEPRFSLARQASLWSWGFAAYALCCGACALAPFLPGRSPAGSVDAAATVNGQPVAGREKLPLLQLFLWLLLSACSSALLLATTNQLCQEVAVVPFLWVLPLALYLGTFIACFSGERSYDRTLWGMLLVGVLGPACWVLSRGVAASLPQQVLVYLAALVTGCMVCHGELFRCRPDPRHLTAYYLVIATGGALGGIFVALAAPLLFAGFWEYPVALVVLGGSALLAWYRGGAFAAASRWLPVVLVAGELALVAFTVRHVRALAPWTVATERNFYGVLRVIRDRDQRGEKLTLMHGQIAHGNQYQSPEERRRPTTYYARESGAGLALTYHQRRGAAAPAERSLRVGVVGLGTGTLAAFGQAGDLFRFYEINPEVIAMANRYFSYLRDSAARSETRVGDARIVLEQELRRGDVQRFDVLLVDAFSSDAIPVHLLTRESLALYRRHLAPDGLLLFHITNRFLDLRPVLRAHAEEAGEYAVLVPMNEDAAQFRGKSDWVILTRNAAFLNHPEVRPRLSPLADGPPSLLWSDDFASLWQVLKR